MFYIIVSPGYSPSQFFATKVGRIFGHPRCPIIRSTRKHSIWRPRWPLCTKFVHKGSTPIFHKICQNGSCFRGFPMISMISSRVFFVASCCITILPFPWFGDDSWADSWADSSADSSDARLGFRHKLRFGAILRCRGLLCPDFTTFHHNWLGWG